MERATLEVIISDFQNRKSEQGVLRELKVPLNLTLKKSITISGPRRCGKTFFCTRPLTLCVKKWTGAVSYLSASMTTGFSRLPLRTWTCW